MTSLYHRMQTRLVLLPPARLDTRDVFRKVETDSLRHDQLIAEMQRLRGSVYVADGAIPKSALTADGRHRMPIDERSWHILSLDREDRVCACLRYLDESTAAGFDHLWVRHASLADTPVLGRQFRKAVEGDMRLARRLHMGFGEVGGWAVAETHRRTFEPLRIILATYGLLRLLGGVIGVATATLRHDSATILRRIGLTSLVQDGGELPPYFDPHYGCPMEVLQFDSRHPASKYEDWVGELADALRRAPVICRERPRTALKGVLAALELAPQALPALSWQVG